MSATIQNTSNSPWNYGSSFYPQSQNRYEEITPQVSKAKILLQNGNPSTGKNVMESLGSPAIAMALCVALVYAVPPLFGFCIFKGLMSLGVSKGISITVATLIALSSFNSLHYHMSSLKRN